MVQSAAILASLLLACLAVFQLLLVAGLPLGKFAWGGQYTTLPTKLRVSSAVSIILYAFFAVIILNQAGVIHKVDTDGWTEVALVVLTVYFFIGIVMNAISRSKPERLVMTPTATILAFLFLYVAIRTR